MKLVCVSQVVKNQPTKTTPNPIPISLTCTLGHSLIFLFSSFNRIDKKMSGGQSGYELSEAKAILTELKSIRKAISSGEKEKQDLMQVCDGTCFQVTLLPSWASETFLEAEVLHRSLEGPLQPHKPHFCPIHTEFGPVGDCYRH